MREQIKIWDDDEKIAIAKSEPLAEEDGVITEFEITVTSQDEVNGPDDDVPELEQVALSTDDEEDSGETANILDQAIIEEDSVTESCITTESNQSTVQTEPTVMSEDNALNQDDDEETKDQVLIIEGGAILIEGKEEEVAEMDENANVERSVTPRFDHHQFKARLKEFALRKCK